MSMDRLMREEARLIILRELSEQIDESLGSERLRLRLRDFAIRVEREWIHDELRWLQQMGAITTTDAGSILIATLTEKGARHVAREIAIEGVMRPSRPR